MTFRDEVMVATRWIAYAAFRFDRNPQRMLKFLNDVLGDAPVYIRNDETNPKLAGYVTVGIDQRSVMLSINSFGDWRGLDFKSILDQDGERQTQASYFRAKCDGILVV